MTTATTSVLINGELHHVPLVRVRVLRSFQGRSSVHKAGEDAEIDALLAGDVVNATQAELINKADWEHISLANRNHAVKVVGNFRSSRPGGGFVSGGRF